ncbi:flavin reductase [Micromonospora echinofusca]|uniref:Flavin reductase n=1 Tax=Micromonospora echinofusca TaxID=47858 RepID=A0ABS3VK13_MICEH|nr:flavin reductase [Micromonospora echinofusca]MBO4204871.1 flavin reductase [Micromonospora echinofusca]
MCSPWFRPGRAIPHTPMRPLWRCRNCWAEWPCQPARLAMLAEFRDSRTVLLIYLSSLMAEALSQLGRPEQDGKLDLHDRFIAWARAR